MLLPMRRNVVVAAVLVLLACSGPVGPPGAEGPQGPSGAEGPQGPSGEQGPSGDRGGSGSPGSPGDPGTTNLFELDGYFGLEQSFLTIAAQIDAIEQSLARQNESVGSQGERGPAGEQGIPGPFGPQGIPGEPEADISDHLFRLRDSIVYIEAGLNSGSGVLIGPNEILTAQHIVGTSSTATVDIDGVGRILTVVTGYDAQRNVALLTFTGPGASSYIDIPELFITEFDPVRGSNVTRTAYGHGIEVVAIGFIPIISTTSPIATFGRISVVWDLIPGNIHTLQTDAVTTDGMRGGGLFNNRGEFAGLLVSNRPDFVAATRAVSYREILEVLPDLRAGLKQ
jgi:hypothetical protein